MPDKNPSFEIKGDCIGIPDRRKHERHTNSLRLGLILLTVQNQPEIKVQVNDLSTGGMGFHARRAFLKGDCVVLRMPAIRGLQKLVLCQIKYCHVAEDGDYTIGTEFLETISLPEGAAVPSQWINHAPISIKIDR